MSSIALFGGSFDPFHFGHFQMAQVAQKSFSLDKIIFLPSFSTPQKKPPLFSASERLKILQTVLSEIKWAEVNDYEISQEMISYSFKTVHYFRSSFPSSRIFFLLGADQWKNLISWKNLEGFISEVEWIIFSRRNQASEFSDSSFLKNSSCKCHFFPLFQANVSSSDIKKDFQSLEEYASSLKRMALEINPK